MLSLPAATGSKGERLALGRRPIGCETQPDLVFARARETQINKRLHRYRTRILEPLRRLGGVKCVTSSSKRSRTS
jgi:hypothetical protein